MSRFDPPSFEHRGPSRTGDLPATRWVRAGAFSGWFAVGRREMRDREQSFWRSVLQLLCRIHGSNADACHGATSGVVALGPLGLTLASGDGVALLSHCLLANPVGYLDAMADAMHETCVYPVKTELHLTSSRRLLSPSRIRDAITGSSDGREWTDRQKATARIWVTSISSLLSRDEMIDAQASLLSTILPDVMTAETRAMVRFPREVEGLWQYTPEQRALWLFALALSTVDPVLTRSLISEAHDEETCRTLARLGEAVPTLADPLGSCARLSVEYLLESSLWRLSTPTHP